MGQTLADLATSKKFLMMVIGLVVWFAGRYGIQLDPSALYPAVAIIISAIFGQAIADHGKEAALVTSNAQAVNDADARDAQASIDRLIADVEVMKKLVADIVKPPPPEPAPLPPPPGAA